MEFFITEDDSIFVDFVKLEVLLLYRMLVGIHVRILQKDHADPRHYI